MMIINLFIYFSKKEGNDHDRQDNNNIRKVVLAKR